MGKLLINEYPLQVLPTLATYVGLNEAIVLQQIHYWLENSKIGKRDNDGVKWVRNSIKEWQADNFPFWSDKLIARTLNNLIEDGLIRWTDQLNRRKADRTRWYTINYQVLDTLNGPVERITQKTQKRQDARNGNKPDEQPKGQNVLMPTKRTSCPQPKGQVVPNQKDKLSPTLPETTTETTTEKGATPELPQCDPDLLLSFGLFGQTQAQKITDRDIQAQRDIESVWIKRVADDTKLALVAFLAAMRRKYPNFAPPCDKNGQGEWGKGVNDHLANYALADLPGLYAAAIQLQIDNGLDIYRPQSLDKAMIKCRQQMGTTNKAIQNEDGSYYL